MKTRTVFRRSQHCNLAVAALPVVLAGVSLPVLSAPVEEAVREPSEVYRQVCSHCHAPQYGVGPEITIAFPEAAWKARGNYVRMTVRNGRAAMPALREAKISDPELDGLIKALVSGELDDAPVEKE
jgi:mono/diheme cytochrome c family protein